MQGFTRDDPARIEVAPAGRRTPALSIVICTYNRCAKLPQALRAIECACRDHRNDVELIVVDNNSSDDTRIVLESFACTSTLPTRCVTETGQGISFARNRGLREAGGRIMAFTDDDCIVCEDWVAVILRELENNPDIGLIGGRVDLHCADDRPVSIRPFDRRVRYSRPGHVLTLIMGCNFACRREVAERVGPFDPAFGSTNGVVGDDIDFIWRAARQGVCVEFVPEMAVRHDHGRRRDEEIERLRAGYVRGRGAFYAKFALRGDVAVLRLACLEVWGEIRLIVRRLLAGEPVGAELTFLRWMFSGPLRLAVSRMRQLTGGAG